MKSRELGRSGIKVAPLAFGGNVFGWTVDEKTAFELLDAFVDAGLNLIDTADIYSTWVPGNTGGESETIIGKWLKKSGKRDKVMIATKVGLDMPYGKGLSKTHIRKAVEASLKRLQIETIDLYQSHTDDRATPLEETLSVYADLIAEGKVRNIGASNYDAARLAEALEVSAKSGLPRYETLQPHYNLIEREGFEKELEALCLEREIGVIPYYPLAAGFLTGKYRSEADLGKSRRGDGAKAFLNERGFRILRALDEVAEETRSTPARVALAWLMARKSIRAPIASATSLSQLNDLVESVRLELSQEAIAKLDQASGKDKSSLAEPRTTRSREHTL